MVLLWIAVSTAPAVKSNWRATRARYLLPALVIFASCIPVPHTLWDLPSVQGTVVADGQPVADIRLHVTDVTRANPCERGEQVATSDSKGVWFTPGRRRVALWVPLLPVHAMDTWAVALLQSGTPVGYVRPWNYRAGPRYAPRNVELSCDLTKRECLVSDRTWGYEHRYAITPCEQFPHVAYSTPLY